MREADNLTAFLCRLKSVRLNLLESSGPLQACSGIALPLSFMHEMVVKQPKLNQQIGLSICSPSRERGSFVYVCLCSFRIWYSKFTGIFLSIFIITSRIEVAFAIQTSCLTLFLIPFILFLDSLFLLEYTLLALRLVF